jgi:hypothetical protein
MRKSTLIGRCLLNSGMVTLLTDGEDAVRNTFTEEFPNDDFLQWDSDVEASVADHMIAAVGRAMTINVRKLILDLWKE